jgi:hypothetical protein
MNTIAPYLDPFYLKEGRSYRGITIFPICRSAIGPESGLLPLAEAIRDGLADALETGRMDTILIQNHGERSLLAIDGETLLGGAQNRVLAGGTLVSARNEFEIPSACVEVKRWEVAKKGNDHAENVQKFSSCGFAYTELRRMNLSESLHSASVDMRITLNQKKIWENIVHNIVECEAETRTIDMHDLFTHWERQIALFKINFPTVPSQCGTMVFSGPAEWFVDIFADRDLLLGYHSRILAGHALDALMRESSGVRPVSRQPSLKTARERFRGLRVTRTLPQLTNHPGLMLFGNARCNGIALLSAGALIHLAACSV